MIAEGLRRRVMALLSVIVPVFALAGCFTADAAVTISG